AVRLAGAVDLRVRFSLRRPRSADLAIDVRFSAGRRIGIDASDHHRGRGGFHDAKSPRGRHCEGWRIWHGIAALPHGIADIGMTSRDLTPQERAYAGDGHMELSLVPLALDAVVLIVNRANPIVALDLRQVQDIFAAKIRNWREFDGADAQILPYARAA